MRYLLLTTLSTWAVAGLASPLVTVDEGRLRGGNCSAGQNAVYYKGVPFAEPPVGALRFEPPKAYSKRYPNGELDATVHAANCIQFGDSTVPPGPKSEDCLYLDIWTPSNATRGSMLPVKVWVYGGSNKEGGIDYPLYDGCNIAEEGSILVSINYRLGPLGFMALESAGIFGNQGIQDLLLGLQWVQKSISAFGGDPKKVVLIGQSAGATDVHTIATLPQAPSLFKSAIVESIALPSLMENRTLQMTSASFAQTLRCDVHDKSCLQSKSMTEIQNALKSDTRINEGLGSGDYPGIRARKTPGFWPYIDDKIISKNPLRHGVQVPTIFGYNQLEGMMDALTWVSGLKRDPTPSDYGNFLRQNFGAATQVVEKYYPFSVFESAFGNSTKLAVLAAIATVSTDSEFKCSGYQSAVQAAHNNVPAWMYEFTHNSTCAWLDTMPQKYIQLFGAAHTAELPYVFGNLRFAFANETCTGSEAEFSLSKQMMSLWTAMAKDANPETDGIHWPRFQVTANGSSTPGMIFGNSSMPGSLDLSVCRMWTQVNAMLDASNTTTKATPSGIPHISSGTQAALPLGGAGAVFLTAAITLAYIWYEIV